MRILSKKHLKWDWLDNLEQLRQKLSLVLSKFTPSTIASVTGWDFILYQFTKVARKIRHPKYIPNQSKNERYLQIKN